MKIILTIGICLITLSCWSQNTRSKSFYKFKTLSDSTFIIVYGNDKITKKTEPISGYVRERIDLKYRNSQYLGFQASTGSDSWFLMLLTLDANSREKYFYNPLAVDLKNQIVVFEYCGKDSSIMAENIRSGKRQNLSEKWEQCGSGFPHYCIDSFTLRNNVLQLDWVLPDITEQNPIRHRKVVRIKI